MKVENDGLNQINRDQVKSVNPLERGGRPADSSRVDGLDGKDRASLSERARLMLKARARLEESPEIRQELVDEIRGRLQAGELQVPFEAIAGKILARIRLND